MIGFTKSFVLPSSSSSDSVSSQPSLGRRIICSLSASVATQDLHSQIVCWLVQCTILLDMARSRSVHLRLDNGESAISEVGSAELCPLSVSA